MPRRKPNPGLRPDCDHKNINIEEIQLAGTTSTIVVMDGKVCTVETETQPAEMLCRVICKDCECVQVYSNHHHGGFEVLPAWLHRYMLEAMDIQNRSEKP